MGELRYENFTVDGAQGSNDPRGAEFVRAIDYGFLESPRGAENEVAQLDRFRAENTVLGAVYDDGQDPRAVGAQRPVATFGDYVGSVCVVPGVVLPAQMVTEVTVRGTHRRRGILTKLMTSALQRAKDDGLALSLLTASEGGIYGRFGFGVSAFSSTVTIPVAKGLQLRAQVAESLKSSGMSVIVPSWEAFATMYEDVFAAFQLATPGQTGHTQSYRDRAAGKPNPWAVKGEDRAWRPLVVLGADGAALAYAITEFAGFEKEPLTLKIADLGAANPLAELALWEALGATDLAEQLRWREAPDDFALPYALINQRDVKVAERDDHLWLRILDLPAAFESRGLRGEGTLTLKVSDRLGHIAGEWTLDSRGGSTTVTPGIDASAEGAPSLAIDAEGLGTLFLGTVLPSVLVGSGRAVASSADLDALDAMFMTFKAPRNAYTF